MPEMQIRAAIKRGLKEGLDLYPDMFIIGEDIGTYGGAYAVTDGLLSQYGPKRIVDAPIAEAGFTGLGIGAAVAGMRPVVEMMSISFTLVAFDQIINMAANLRYMSGGQIKVPLVIRAPTGAGVQLGATHSNSFETWLCEVPGLKCVCPSTPYDALGLIRTSIKDDNPVMFAEPALLYGLRGEVPDEYYEVPFGKASVRSEGSDITIVSYGAGMPICEEAQKVLKEKDGISAEVIDLRSLYPLDMETIYSSVKKTNRLALLDAARLNGGVMAEILSNVQLVCGDYIDGPVVRVGAKDVPWPYNRSLEKAVMPNANRLTSAIKEVYGI